MLNGVDASSSVLIGLISGFVGAFPGGFARFFWEHYLPDALTWRRKQAEERRRVVSEFRDPMVRAAYDLQSRLYNLIDQGGFTLWRSERERGGEQYFRNSTSFVLAQYCAWAEILSQRIEKLDYEDLWQLLDRVSHALAVYPLSFYRLEQRELAERMLRGPLGKDEPQLVSYSEFLDRLGSEPSGRLAGLVSRLEDGLRKSEAYPRVGLAPAQRALVELIEYLQGKSRWIPPERLRRASPPGPPTLPDG